MTKPAPSANLLALCALAHQAGAKIMEIYATDFAAEAKADASPVTEADKAAEAIILAGLARLWPDVPVVAEEQAAAGHVPDVAAEFMLVDPLDGTREFISRNGEFTVNIARVRAGVPVAGVVYAPALDEMFVGALGEGAFAARLAVSDPAAGAQFHAITTRPAPETGPAILASRSHLDAQTKAFIDAQPGHSLVSAGSSLKFCRIAEGKADLYPRFGRTMEWDTAAGHAVLLAAGGQVRLPEGGVLAYGKPGFANTPFIATGAAWPRISV
ncbi:MAG: 3'(2'),5'-bisphosphate nucleotidase CysQ [Alphaproteobacteria bacterium]|nr:3'(2'),5'-bisphosphate nucleotidase CysQ [Alphaproteobacteria bacterium]